MHRAVAPDLRPLAVWAFLIGSIAPDIDMLLFYFLHDRQMHHHEHLTHRPALWIGILIAGLMLRSRVASGTGGVLVALSLGAVLHVALDSIAGRINWDGRSGI